MFNANQIIIVSIVVEKTSTETDHFSELRDNACHQLANANKFFDLICTLVGNLQKSNNESDNQINSVKIVNLLSRTSIKSKKKMFPFN